MGYLAVALQVGSKHGDAVGYVKVKEGTHHNVVVPIHDKLTTGTYFLLLSSGSPPTGTVVELKPKWSLPSLSGRELCVLTRRPQPYPRLKLLASQNGICSPVAPSGTGRRTNSPVSKRTWVRTQERVDRTVSYVLELHSP